MRLNNISVEKYQLTDKKTLDEAVREDCQAFLKTKEGLKYLQKHYAGPIESAVKNYINEVTWVTSLV